MRLRGRTPIDCQSSVNGRTGVRRRELHGECAFTLVELLVVIAIIAILAGLVVSGVSGAHAKSDQSSCLNNLRQLQMAWLMYVDDHRGQVPENYADNDTGFWRSSPNSWAGRSSATHDLDETGLKTGAFYRLGYIRSTASFRCPADDSMAIGNNERLSDFRRTRSYSMNGNFGGRPQESQTVFDRENVGYEASKTFVFVDEHEDSIDDAHFLVWPSPDDRWVNLPSGRHRGSGVFSFADGHAEVWHWLHDKNFNSRESYWKRAKGSDLRDLRRVQDAIVPVQNYQPRE